jgi:hypothetical protein
MKKVYSIFIFTIITSIILVVGSTTLMARTASGEAWENGEKKEVDIETDPTEYLFQLSNIKPGDYADREILLTNSGERNFSYFTEVEFESGSREILNSFLLKIKDDSGKVLYDGNLLNLMNNSFEMRYLPVGAKDKLLFTISFPDSGKVQNHLQNKMAKFTLSFIAEEYVNRDLGFKMVTGGGTVEHKNSSGKKGNSFGFNVLPKKDGLSVNLQYTDNQNKKLKDIHVNDYAYNVSEIIENKVVIGIEFDVIGEIDKQEVRIHVKVVDNGEPGKNDKFYLEVINGPKEYIGYISGNENMTGGNIQVHK